MRWYLPRDNLATQLTRQLRAMRPNLHSFGTAAVPHLPSSIRTRSGHVTICVLGDTF